jgi:hypothetical protein
VLRVASLVCIAVHLAGCTQAQAVQDWISPPTPAQMTDRLQQQAAAGHANEALAAGEAYLVQHPADAQDLHRSMAQLYLAQGNAGSAVRHLAQAGTGTGMTLRRAAADRSDPPPAMSPSPDVPSPAPFGASVDGASAQVLPDGSVSVRAGGVTASTGNLSR